MGMDLARRGSRNMSADFTATADEISAGRDRDSVKKLRSSRRHRSRDFSGTYDSLPSYLDRSPSGSSSSSATLTCTLSWKWIHLVTALFVGALLMFILLKLSGLVTLGSAPGMMHALQKSYVDDRNMMESLSEHSQDTLNAAAQISQRILSHDHPDSLSEKKKALTKKEKLGAHDTALNSKGDSAHEAESKAVRMNLESIEHDNRGGSGQNIVKPKQILGRKGGVPNSEKKASLVKRQDKEEDKDEEGVSDLPGDDPSNTAVVDQDQTVTESTNTIKVETTGWEERNVPDPMLDIFLAESVDAATHNGVIDPHAADAKSDPGRGAKRIAELKQKKAAAKLLRDQEEAEAILRDTAATAEQREAEQEEKKAKEAAEKLLNGAKTKERDPEEVLQEKREAEQNLQKQQEAAEDARYEASQLPEMQKEAERQAVEEAKPSVKQQAAVKGLISLQEAEKSLEEQRAKDISDERADAEAKAKRLEIFKRLSEEFSGLGDGALQESKAAVEHSQGFEAKQVQEAAMKEPPKDDPLVQDSHPENSADTADQNTKASAQAHENFLARLKASAEEFKALADQTGEQHKNDEELMSSDKSKVHEIEQAELQAQAQADMLTQQKRQEEEGSQEIKESSAQIATSQ